jgi:uncharacterized protein (DUF1684 family)
MRASRPLFQATVACLLLLVGSPMLAAGDEPSEERMSHANEIETWHQDRLASLQEEDGWLTLTGLAWLEEGESACGSDPKSPVVLPPASAAQVGTFYVAGKKVEFAAAPGVAVTSDGQAVGRLTLADDASGAATLLKVGSVTFHVIRRGERLGVRIKDSASPVRAGFRGIETYPVSADWSLEAHFEPYDPPKPVLIASAAGTVEDTPSPGAVVFQVPGGETYRIDALPGGEGELFLVFGDKTNGHETYGGGRFLYASLAADGKVALDFNKAYNPPCVFTPYATCPLPPRQNRLGLLIRAGEKNYGDGH